MAKDIELISLNDIIPPSISGDRHIQSIISATDPQLQEVSQSIREAFIISRINELPENVIDLLAWQWHVDSYEPDLSIETKRGLVRDSVRWHRKKGTKSAIKIALERLGFVPTFLEWFEIGTKPHTFEIYGHYRENDLNVFFLGPDTEEILTRVVEITKPARSKLISLIVAPIPPDMKKHACYWDGCIWGHPSIELHDWGLLPLPVFENDPLTNIDFVHGFNVISDTQLWDISTWGGVPYRELRYYKTFERGILADLQRESTATWYIPYCWGKFTWGDSERYSRDFELDFQRDNSSVDADIKPLTFGTDYIIGMLASLLPYWDYYTWTRPGSWSGLPYREPISGNKFERGILADLERENTVAWYIPYSWRKFTTKNSEIYSRDFELDCVRGMEIETNIKPNSFGTVYFINMLASLQPYWDCYTWWQHKEWVEIFGISQFAPGFMRDNKASVQWSEDEAPYAKWSRFRTWGDATWDKSPTSAGTWETGAWIDDFEEAS
ncbi:MAG: phage tail protein I [Synergistaceae bacterium]|nr:phage tail protein I [Synergistaceae bacterium]